MNYPNEIFIESSNGAGSTIEAIKLYQKFDITKIELPRPLALFNKNFSSEILSSDSFLVINSSSVKIFKTDSQKGNFILPMTSLFEGNGVNFIDALAYDFSGDGYEDLILADTEKQEILIWTLKDGSEKDFKPYLLEPNFQIQKNTKFFAWDLNEDTLKDLICISSIQGQIYFSSYINKSSNGSISFDSPIVYKAVHDSTGITSNLLEKPFAATIYDFDQDSIDDFAVMTNETLYFFDHVSFIADPGEKYTHAHSAITITNFPFAENLKIKPYDYDNDGKLDLEITSKNYVFWTKTKTKSVSDLSHILDQSVENSVGVGQIIETNLVDIDNDGKKEYLISLYNSNDQQNIYVGRINSESFKIDIYDKLNLPDYRPNDVINAPIWANFDGLQIFDKELFEGSMLFWRNKIDLFHVKLKKP